MVDRQSNWSLISAVRHIWAPYHHDQCWVSLLPTAPGGVPSRRDGSLNDVVTLFPPLSNPVWAETTQRDQATKYGWQQIQNTELATKPNTNYRACNKCKIQLTRLTTNTKYRAGKKTELDQSQSLGLAAFLPEQPVEFHLHSCQNNLHNQFCNLQKDLKIHLPLQSQIKAAMIQL